MEKINLENSGIDISSIEYDNNPEVFIEIEGVRVHSIGESIQDHISFQNRKLLNYLLISSKTKGRISKTFISLSSFFSMVLVTTISPTLACLSLLMQPFDKTA